MRVQFLRTARKIFIPAIALLLLTVNFSSAEQVARLSVHWRLSTTALSMHRYLQIG